MRQEEVWLHLKMRQVTLALPYQIIWQIYFGRCAMGSLVCYQKIKVALM